MNISAGTINSNLLVTPISVEQSMMNMIPSYITSGGNAYRSVSSVTNGDAPSIIMSVNGVVVTEEELLQQFIDKDVSKESKEFYTNVWKRKIEEVQENERNERNPRRINFDDFQFNSSGGIATV